MEPQASAQLDTVADESQGNGVQKRIDELTAARRQAEEREKALQTQLMETTAQMAQLAMQARQAQQPAPQAPVDPLAQFKDALDPTVTQAIQAAVAETQRRMQAQYEPMFAQQAAQMAGYAVQAEAANIKGLPPEVTQRAAVLAADWRSRGIQLPVGDAINFALGEYQRGQLSKAAAVTGYDPRTQAPGTIPGFTPPPQTQVRALPQNFDQLNRSQQNAALEAAGILDAPL